VGSRIGLNRIDNPEHPGQHCPVALGKTTMPNNPNQGIGLHQFVGVHFSLTASQGDVKGARFKSPWLICICLPIFAPAGAVFYDPIRQSLLKTNIPPSLFRLNPFMFKDFLTLRLEFTVKRRVFQQIIRG
jgi:hypothetical protein